MTTDLIQRLRFLASGQDDPHSQALTEAAAELERLQGELKARHQRQHDAEALAGEYLMQRDDARAGLERLRALVAPAKAAAESLRYLGGTLHAQRLEEALAAGNVATEQQAEAQAAHDNAILERGIQLGMYRERQRAEALAQQAPSLTVGGRAAPTIPSSIIQLVSAYGDSRADGVLVGDALGAVIKALRAWGAGLAQPAAQAEPVAWQSRFVSEGSSGWRECTKEHHALVQENPDDWQDGYETRALFAGPPSNHPAQGVEDARDAARWRAVANVFHITDQVGERTGQHAVKLSTHWAAWVDGKHASVTDAVDAYAAAMAAEKEQQ